jgi:hypothetical protein
MSGAMEPAVVWDAGERAWLRDRKAKSAWLEERGFPVNQMYRAEFYLIDAPFARIFCYALNDNGRKHGFCGSIVREEPRDVLLDELPPTELR